MSESRFTSWLVVFSAASFFFFQFINMNSFDALSPYLRQAFHADAVQISTLSAMYFYGNIFMIPTGLLLDRFSTKRLLLIGSITAVICTFLFGHTHSLVAAFVLRFMIGVCSTLCFLSCAKLTSRWFPSHMAGYVIGWVLTFAMLGGIVAQQLDPIIPHLSNWRIAVDGVSGIGCISVLLILFFVKDYPKSYEQQHKQNVSNLKKGFWPNFRGSMANPQNWLNGIYGNTLTLPVVVIGALFAESYLQHVHHVSGAQAAFVSSMIFFGVLVGSPFYGLISDKLKKRKSPMIIGAALTLVMSILIIYIPHLSVTMLTVLFFLMGFFSGSQVIPFAVVIEANPPHRTASSESLAALIIMSAGMIFQPLFAWILQSYENAHMKNGVIVYSTAAYHHAMLMVPIVIGVGLLCGLFIKETHCKSVS